MDVDKPDEKSIMTYVAQFLKHHPDRQETEIGLQQEEVLYIFLILQLYFNQLSIHCMSHGLMLFTLLNDLYQQSVCFVDSRLSNLPFSCTIFLSLYSSLCFVL